MTFLLSHAPAATADEFGVWPWQVDAVATDTASTRPAASNDDDSGRVTTATLEVAEGDEWAAILNDADETAAGSHDQSKLPSIATLLPATKAPPRERLQDRTPSRRLTRRGPLDLTDTRRSRAAASLVADGGASSPTLGTPFPPQPLDATPFPSAKRTGSLLPSPGDRTPADADRPAWLGQPLAMQPSDASEAAREAAEELELLRRLRALDRDNELGDRDPSDDDDSDEGKSDGRDRMPRRDDRPAPADLLDLSDDADRDEDDADAADDRKDPIEAGQTKRAYELRPKSIAKITPFERYNPDAADGEDDADPCRYQCPRQPSCPELDGEDAEQYQCPEAVPLPSSATAMRTWGEKRYHWVASDVRYNPLYFEDAQLERYGQVSHPAVQPFVSTGKLFAQALTLPYLAAIDPPHSCVTPLGYYRPGECAPKLHSAIPVDGRSAFEAAIFYTGAILVAP